VDAIGRVSHLTQEGDSWWFSVEFPEEFARYVVPKGSITIDGISLTVARCRKNFAEIAVIPYTYEHTNIRDRKAGDAVNLEGDVLGKYVERYLELRKTTAGISRFSIEELREEGF
jgi:riboflavin synthase